MIPILLHSAALLLQATAAPTLPPPLTENPAPATIALGRRLAATGTLATMLPLVAEKELAELASKPKDATPEQRARILATGRRVAAERIAALVDTTGRAYARYLSADDLRTLVAAAESPAAVRKRAADPAVIAATMQAMAGIDLKRDVSAAVCAEQKLLCTS